MPRILMVVSFLSFLVGFWDPAQATEEKAPFLPGERLTFELRWTVIPAGEAVLEVLPVQTVNGIESYHFALTARSNAFIDHFYKVRDRIDAFADTAMNGSVLYLKKQHEGRTRRDIQVTFDRNDLKADYFRSGKKKKQIDIPSGTFDPLSVFYYSRWVNLSENMEIQRPVSDGQKSVIGRARVVRRETLTLACGEFDTFLIEPEVEEIGGVFEKCKDAKIQVWVTADQRRIPVKIQSRVAVGTFVGELVAAEGI
jgi:hypothetical protein